VTAPPTTASGRDARPARAEDPFARVAEGTTTSRLAVGALVLLLAVPNLVRGPQLLADDYIWLRNARFGGWFAAGGPRTYSRPASMLGADLTFGLIGPHPLALYLVQVALWLVAALAVLGLLRRLFGPRAALAVTLVWLLVPNHTSLEYWLSTSQAWSALAVAAFGISRIIDDTRRDRTPWVGIALVTLGVLFYELTGGVALAAVTVLPLLLTGRFQRRTAVVGVLAIGAASAWSLAWNSSYPGVTSTWLPMELVLTGTLSLGLSPYSPAGRLLSLAITVAVLVVGYQAWKRPRLRRREPYRLVLSGAAVVALGVLPQVRLQTNFYGMYDRSNTVAAIGTALVLVGLAELAQLRLRAAQRPWASWAAVAVLLVLAVVVRAHVGREYHDQGRRAAIAVDHLRRAGTHYPLVVGKPFVDGDWIYGLQDGWNATAALQARSGDGRAVVWVRNGCIASGPPLDQPRATFGKTAPNQLLHLARCRALARSSP